METRKYGALRRASAIICALLLTPCMALDASTRSFWQGTHFAARFVDEGEMKKPPVMDSQSLVDAMLSFLNKDFDVETAERIWGEIDITTNPYNLFLRPKYDWVERVSLGFFDKDGERLFSSIFVDLKESSPINMNKLIAAFGEPEESPRLKPNQPRPHSFEVQGQDFSGYLTIGLDPGKGKIRGLRDFGFVRLEPNTHK